MRLSPINHKRARVEIVPMIDTIFFLLVYFMIASLTMTPLNAEKVAMPVSRTASAHVMQTVVVTVDANGRCFLDRDSVAMLQIAAALRARIAATPDITVVINCDRSQPVAVFASVFDLVKQANPKSVMVATTPSDQWAVH